MFLYEYLYIFIWLNEWSKNSSVFYSASHMLKAHVAQVTLYTRIMHSISILSHRRTFINGDYD